MNDHLVRILTADGSLRAVAAVTTTLVEECRQRQNTDPTATVALGRLATAAALMGALLKGEQRLALMIEANGPLQKIHAETDAAGRVRASIKHPLANLPPRDGRFDVAGAVGRAGFLHVVKDLGLKEPYRGLIQLQSSEIAEDLAYYFTVSEQTPSTVALGVDLDEVGRVRAAGGFLIQVMPDCPEETIATLEERLAAFPPTTALLQQGLNPLQILQRLFGGIPFSVQAEMPLAFRCTCSRRQIETMLCSLGANEMAELTARKEPTEVTCEFCREVYRFEPGDLAQIAGRGA